jgi:hypothetical protein
VGDIYGGECYGWTDGMFVYQCSIGFNGYATHTDNNEFVTAGHRVNNIERSVSGFVQTYLFTSLQSISDSSPVVSTIGLSVPGTVT